MFLKTQLSWNVIIPAESFDAKGLMLQRSIIVRLMDQFVRKKATKDLGYFMAIKDLESIGEGRVRELTGEVVFPIVFTAISFKLFRGGDSGGGSPQEFLSEKAPKIGKDVKLRFMVIGTKWMEVEREIQALVSLEDDYLGPVS
ncbi:hypothetical protein MLD38_027286 [Melastoma candidum]|uniref:Uncharacterized protein n=1 Tax=Melastoma candidum TaxID=119954 RepID=A0ACB9P4B4_9MYRT|nr:hypothetical protein MLD38_027286 [Melastoma candidum]